MATQAEIDEFSQYGYLPTEWITILFIVLFSISTILHLGQSLRYRMWFLLPTAVLGGIGEIIGWAGRFWSTQTFLASGDTPFTIQISTTIIAPTPLVAANFIILGMLIRHLGPQYSRLGPRLYSIIFCSVDIAALVVQAIGGGIASGNDPTGHNQKLGGNIMLAGIIIQLVAITVYVSLASDFLFHYARDQPVREVQAHESVRGSLDQRVKRMVFGLSLSTVCLFIRAIYRTVELSDGWEGKVIHTQYLFNIFDGTMVIIAIYAINVFHPGRLLAHVLDAHKVDAESGTSNGSSGSWDGSRAELKLNDRFRA